MEIYVVVIFGCNSTGNDMWVPETYVFTDKEEAFTFYHKNAPSLDDQDNCRAEKQPVYPKSDYIDAIMQVHGYLDGDMSCAKRPYGAKISRHIIKLD